MGGLWRSTAEAGDCEAIARGSWGGWIRTTDYLIQSHVPVKRPHRGDSQNWADPAFRNQGGSGAQENQGRERTSTYGLK